MKYLKIFGFAAGITLALIVSVGVSTASATVLCKNNINSEMCTEPYPAGTELVSSLISGGKARIVTSFNTIECTKSSLGALTETAGSASATVKGPITILTFESCNCEVKVLKKGAFEIHYISGSLNSTITTTGQEVTSTCSTIFGTVHCVYGTTTNTDVGTFTGGIPGKFDINGKLPRLPTNALCSEEATWTAEYELTSPGSVFSAAG